MPSKSHYKVFFALIKSNHIDI